MANLTCRILWWVLIGSLVVYVAVAHVAQVVPNQNAPISLLFPVFVALSIAIAIATIIIRRRALSEPIQAGRLDPSTPQGLQAAFTPFILNLVLSESVGIYGLVLAFLSAQPLYSAGFSAAAIALMFVHRPTARDLVPPMSAQRP
ncbi:MAG: hypothetical protein JRF15_02635 [Deltaproteobacteria bacterium]|nr:hypothetical protein [Deltaproteobacteria bacterium]